LKQSGALIEPSAVKLLETDDSPTMTGTKQHALGHMACGRMMKLWHFQDHEEYIHYPERREVLQHVDTICTQHSK
jgi:hypothetical protein